MKKKALEEMAGTACQIAFEYPNFDDEYFSDMMVTYEDGSPGFTGSDLQDAAELARTAKDEGMSYDEAKEYVKKNFK